MTQPPAGKDEPGRGAGHAGLGGILLRDSLSPGGPHVQPRAAGGQPHVADHAPVVAERLPAERPRGHTRQGTSISRQGLLNRTNRVSIVVSSMVDDVLGDAPLVARCEPDYGPGRSEDGGLGGGAGVAVY
jgi:hypothetical protein